MDSEYIGNSESPENISETSGVTGTKKKKKIIIAGAVFLIVCMLSGFVSGALGSYLVLSFYPLANLVKSGSETGGDVFVPEYSETAADAQEQAQTGIAADTDVTEETVSEQATVDSYEESASVEVTNEAVQSSEKTKGEIYAEAVNSVVSITAEVSEDYTGLFGRTFTRQYTSSGSGFFITSDGYILTNYHVIEDASAVTVTTYGGDEYEAVITGSEPSNDIAVLKIEGSFTPVELGASSSLRVGDDILVIGNALGELSYTVTDGVVSYLNRSVSTENGNVINMFQTNAAINSGNSGGPVFNMQGQVVGIASAKYASESVEGLGFCIPTDDIKYMVEDIIDCGYVRGQASLGVSVQTVSTSMSYAYNIPTGCYVVAVGSGTAASDAGIKPADVITQIDGQSISGCDDLATVLKSRGVGESLKITLYRDGESLDVTVTTEEYKPSSPRTDYSNVYDY